MAGGRKKGSPKQGGRKKGTPNKLSGVAKEVLRARLQELVAKAWDPMILAQIEQAKGIRYLVVRQTSTGKFLRVAQHAAARLNPDDEIIEVWEKDPSTQAFTGLSDRTIDKPQEPPQEVTVNLQAIGIRLDEAREAARQRNALTS